MIPAHDRTTRVWRRRDGQFDGRKVGVEHCGLPRRASRDRPKNGRVKRQAVHCGGECQSGHCPLSRAAPVCSTLGAGEELPQTYNTRACCTSEKSDASRTPVHRRHASRILPATSTCKSPGTTAGSATMMHKSKPVLNLIGFVHFSHNFVHWESFCNTGLPQESNKIVPLLVRTALSSRSAPLVVRLPWETAVTQARYAAHVAVACNFADTMPRRPCADMSICDPQDYQPVQPQYTNGYPDQRYQPPVGTTTYITICGVNFLHDLTSYVSCRRSHVRTAWRRGCT